MVTLTYPLVSASTTYVLVLVHSHYFLMKDEILYSQRFRRMSRDARSPPTTRPGASSRSGAGPQVGVDEAEVCEAEVFTFADDVQEANIQPHHEAGFSSRAAGGFGSRR